MSGEYDDGYDAGRDSATAQEREAVASYLRQRGLEAEAVAVENGEHDPPRAGCGTTYSLPIEMWGKLMGVPK